jgi:hypothetical protein
MTTGVAHSYARADSGAFPCRLYLRVYGAALARKDMMRL